MAGTKQQRVVVLQDRDRHLLEELGVMRIIDRDQAKVVAGFRSTRRVNDRLLTLTRAGLLKRIPLGSSEQTAYALSGTSLQPSSTIPAVLFVRHQLAINAVYLLVKYRALPLGVRLLRWMRFDQPVSKTLPLIPDGYFEIESSAQVRPMFLEVDLGTEALPVWQKKTQLYLQLALSGEFTKIIGQSQFRVLAIANTERRMQNIRSTVAKSTDKIFWFTSQETIQRDGFWSAVWLRPQGDQRQSLL
jgi:hypothetical protein